MKPQEGVLFQGDALTILKTWDAETFDLICTDPPYQTLTKWLGVGTTGRMGLRKGGNLQHADGTAAFYPTIPNSSLPEYAAEFYRLLKNNTHCYVFCDHETLFPLKEAMERAGFKLWKPIVWDKINIGMGYHYRATYELVAFFEKGKRNLNDLSVSDVLHVKKISGGYPTEKPQQIFETLVKNSTNEGELVLDPFIGSGTCAAAALATGRKFVGIDLSDEALEISRKKISQRTLNKLYKGFLSG